MRIHPNGIWHTEYKGPQLSGNIYTTSSAKECGWIVNARKGREATAPQGTATSVDDAQLNQQSGTPSDRGPSMLAPPALCVDSTGDLVVHATGTEPLSPERWS